MMLKYRKAAKVSVNNLYLFSLLSFIKNKYKYLLAFDLLQKYAVKCDTENHETPRATESYRNEFHKCM